MVDKGGFHYAAGGIGPYYIDLRRGPNSPTILRHFLAAYTQGLTRIKGFTETAASSEAKDLSTLAFVGVPTTGVVYATGLAILHKRPLVVMEKLNPERAHLFDGPSLVHLLETCLAPSLRSEEVGFLGLEDMGVVLATTAALTFNRPSAIMRRVVKGHGTSKTVEASLAKWHEDGIQTLVVMNDPFYPLGEEEVEATLASIPSFEAFGFKVVVKTLPLQDLALPSLNPSLELVEIEDLWTTGTSSIKLAFAIEKAFGRKPSVLVFLDREQGALAKFERLGMEARAIYPIRQVSSILESNGWITKENHSQVMAFVKSFDRPSYGELLVTKNGSSLCVGIDICLAKIPEGGDTTLPRNPYPKTSKGLLNYIEDLMDDLATVPEVQVVKPNLAYYNALGTTFDETLLHSALSLIHRKAKAFGWLVILDTKIGDISRTQAQYAEKYKHFDAVTVHGYMGLDSVSPITDVGLGAYALVFTSNPSRIDLETLPLLTKETALALFKAGVEGHKVYEEATSTGMPTLHPSSIPTFEDAWIAARKEAKPLYLEMAQRLVDWQFAGTVGAVIGGTRSKDGTLKELEEIVAYLGSRLDYLPPLLIPGVGTQGGSAREVIQAICKVCKGLGWEEAKIRKELTKVSINSSSAIDYSPRPSAAAKALADEIREGREGCFA